MTANALPTCTITVRSGLGDDVRLVDAVGVGLEPVDGGAGVLRERRRLDLGRMWLVMFAVALAAVLGDQVAYALGRHCGPRLLDRPKSRLFSPRHSEHARELFERHGPKAVFLARFVPLARTLTPVVAGAARMPRPRFIRFNVAGAMAWSVLTLGGGYLFGGTPGSLVTSSWLRSPSPPSRFCPSASPSSATDDVAPPL